MPLHRSTQFQSLSKKWCHLMMRYLRSKATPTRADGLHHARKSQARIPAARPGTRRHPHAPSTSQHQVRVETARKSQHHASLHAPTSQATTQEHIMIAIYSLLYGHGMDHQTQSYHDATAAAHPSPESRGKGKGGSPSVSSSYQCHQLLTARRLATITITHTLFTS